MRGCSAAVEFASLERETDLLSLNRSKGETYGKRKREDADAHNL